MISRRNILLAVLSASVLGVIVYFPVIPYSSPANSIPFPCFSGCNSIPHGAEVTDPHFDSISLQLFNFGGQYYQMPSSYTFCAVWTCGSVWLWGVLYAILIALTAIDNLGLISRFLSVRSGVKGASAQIGIGALVLLSPLLPWNSALVLEEVIIAGVALTLSGLAELWWFRATENYYHSLMAAEQASVEQAVNKA